MPEPPATPVDVDRAFAALADPTRRAIVAGLSTAPATIAELTAPSGVSKQAVSKHVAQLAAAGLVARTGAGRRAPFALRPEALEAVTGWLDGLRLTTERRYRALDAVLGELAEDTTPAEEDPA